MFNDDRKIIQGLLDHDQAALDCLLKRHAGAIRACLLRRFPGVNTSDVDEAITNAAYRIWTQAHKFNEEIATLAAWFLIIADNLSLIHI